MVSETSVWIIYNLQFIFYENTTSIHIENNLFNNINNITIMIRSIDLRHLFNVATIRTCH